jgi:hypothetical protein
MKTTLKNLSIFILGLLILSACTPSETVPSSDKHEFIITGVKESLGIDIIVENGGRVAEDSVPAGINSLTVFILDSDNNMVYENHYYGDYYYDLYNSIPDSIYIPSMAEGDYSIYAVTLDYYSYYDYYNNEYLTIAPYYYGSNPIYVGSETFTLDEDFEVVVLSMGNISSHIEVSLAEGQELTDASISVIFETSESNAYSFADAALVPYEDGSYINYYTYLSDYYYYEGGPNGDGTTGGGERKPYTADLYVLPSTLSSITVEYWDYYGNYVSQTLDIDPDLELATNDKISVVLDIDEILAGAGSGSFDWENITWNDLGELTIP